MQDSNHIAVAIHEVMKNLPLVGYERASAEMQILLREAQSASPPDIELTQFIVKQLFVAAASFDIPFHVIDAAFSELVSIGFSSEFSKLTCILIFVAWCETPDHAVSAKRLLHDAERLLEDNRAEFGEDVYQQERRLIETHKQRLATLLGNSEIP